MKKITAGVLVFSIIALLGVSLVAAFPFGFGKGMNADLTEEEQEEAQAFHDALQQAIEDGDFEEWKSLMESQLTEENFNLIVQRHQNMEENRAENEQIRNQIQDAMQAGDYETAQQLREQIGKSTTGLQKGKNFGMRGEMQGFGCNMN